jgi:hypothetical protein
MNHKRGVLVNPPAAGQDHYISFIKMKRDKRPAHDASSASRKRTRELAAMHEGNAAAAGTLGIINSLPVSRQKLASYS